MDLVPSFLNSVFLPFSDHNQVFSKITPNPISTPTTGATVVFFVIFSHLLELIILPGRQCQPRKDHHKEQHGADGFFPLADVLGVESLGVFRKIRCRSRNGKGGIHENIMINRYAKLHPKSIVEWSKHGNSQTQ